jgi:hypothetical protein
LTEYRVQIFAKKKGCIGAALGQLEYIVSINNRCYGD